MSVPIPTPITALRLSGSAELICLAALTTETARSADLTTERRACWAENALRPASLVKWHWPIMTGASCHLGPNRQEIFVRLGACIGLQRLMRLASQPPQW